MLPVDLRAFGASSTLLIKLKDKERQIVLPELGAERELLDLSRCCQVETMASIAKAECFRNSGGGEGEGDRKEREKVQLKF